GQEAGCKHARRQSHGRARWHSPADGRNAHDGETSGDVVGGDTDCSPSFPGRPAGRGPAKRGEQREGNPCERPAAVEGVRVAGGGPGEEAPIERRVAWGGGAGGDGRGGWGADGSGSRGHQG